MPSSDSRHRESFDLPPQAAAFDVRAGLSDAIAARVAGAIRALCPGPRLLEIGAGTGEIGVHLAPLFGAGYLGLDRAPAMLARFRARLVLLAGGTARFDTAIGEPPTASLITADASSGWPLVPASYDAVLMSRVAHLIEGAHLAEELLRVLPADGRILIGRRERDRDSVRAMLRRHMRGLLRDAGHSPRGGRRATGLLQECLGAAVSSAEPAVVAEWQVSEAPADGLAAWRNKPGLSGLDLQEEEKRQILEAVESYARATFGADLTLKRASSERYVLEVLTRRSG